MAKRSIKFGIIGCGLMGREFASAVARWCHLVESDATPEIVAICDADPSVMNWYQDHFPAIRCVTTDYRELLSVPDVEAVYCAVPHHLHELIYIDIIQQGKHLLAEKPFGIDLAANTAISAAIRSRPDVLVRCSSEFPFYPGAQKVIKLIESGDVGDIIGVEAGFLHCSDMDPNKPMNWKRRIATNGEYGCMGDLGMHVLHIPLRVGWRPTNVRALLSNIVKERPGNGAEREPCETWDNAILACEVDNGEQRFPMILETKRIAPGETNTWYIKVLGTKKSAEFTTKYPKTLRMLIYSPGESQAWQVEDLGSQSAYSTITGGIFEFGFSDSILQMWAAFCDEVANGDAIRQPFRCATPLEATQSHYVFSAALESQRSAQVVAIDWPSEL